MQRDAIIHAAALAAGGAAFVGWYMMLEAADQLARRGEGKAHVETLVQRVMPIRTGGCYTLIKAVARKGRTYSAGADPLSALRSRTQGLGGGTSGQQKEQSDKPHGRSLTREPRAGQD